MQWSPKITSINYLGIWFYCIFGVMVISGCLAGIPAIASILFLSRVLMCAVLIHLREGLVRWLSPWLFGGIESGPRAWKAILWLLVSTGQPEFLNGYRGALVAWSPAWNVDRPPIRIPTFPKGPKGPYLIGQQLGLLTSEIILWLLRVSVVISYLTNMLQLSMKVTLMASKINL